MMPSVHSGRLRASSVSSMRRTKVPPCWRAKSQLNSAARALPTWKYPVGDGAKRARGAVGSVIRYGWRIPGAGGLPGAVRRQSSSMEMAPVGQPLTASRRRSRNSSGGFSLST